MALLFHQTDREWWQRGSRVQFERMKQKQFKSEFSNCGINVQQYTQYSENENMHTSTCILQLLVLSPFKNLSLSQTGIQAQSHHQKRGSLSSRIFVFINQPADQRQLCIGVKIGEPQLQLLSPQSVAASLGPIIQCVNCLGADVIISQYSSGGSSGESRRPIFSSGCYLISRSPLNVTQY